MSKEYKLLTFEDRLIIESLYRALESPSQIGKKIGFSHSTIYRELARGHTGKIDENSRLEYDPVLAQKKIDISTKNRGRPITLYIKQEE